MKTKNTIVRSLMAAGVLSLVSAAATYATPTIVISTAGFTPITIVDNGAGDTDTTAGNVSYMNLALFGGAIQLTLDSGTTKPAVGTAQSPYMYLFTQISVLAPTAAPRDYTISFFDTDFAATKGLAASTYSGGTPNGSVSFLTGYSSSNSPTGTLTTLNGVTPTGTNFAGNFSGALNSSSSYLLEEQVTFHVPALNNNTSYNASITTTVPDNGLTVSLLGMSLLALGFVRRMLNRSTVSAI